MAEKIYGNVVVLFFNKMTYIETCEENSGNLAMQNEFESVNLAIKIAESLKVILQDEKGLKDEELKQAKAEHLPQMSTLRTSHQRQDTKLR